MDKELKIWDRVKDFLKKIKSQALYVNAGIDVFIFLVAIYANKPVLQEFIYCYGLCSPKIKIDEVTQLYPHNSFISQFGLPILFTSACLMLSFFMMREDSKREHELSVMDKEQNFALKMKDKEIELRKLELEHEDK